MLDAFPGELHSANRQADGEAVKEHLVDDVYQSAIF